MEKRFKSLPKGVSLQVFADETLIFESDAKWLHPLFDFEKWLQTHGAPPGVLSAHDTVAGKAAVALAIRCGIRRLRVNLASELAVGFVADYNAKNQAQIEFSYENLVPRILCETETELENIFDVEEMHRLLMKRVNANRRKVTK